MEESAYITALVLFTVVAIVGWWMWHMECQITKAMREQRARMLNEMVPRPTVVVHMQQSSRHLWRGYLYNAEGEKVFQSQGAFKHRNECVDFMLNALPEGVKLEAVDD